MYTSVLMIIFMMCGCDLSCLYETRVKKICVRLFSLTIGQKEHYTMVKHDYFFAIVVFICPILISCFLVFLKCIYPFERSLISILFFHGKCLFHLDGRSGSSKYPVPFFSYFLEHTVFFENERSFYP